MADYESHFADGAADGRTQEEVAAAWAILRGGELRPRSVSPLGGKPQRGQFHGRGAGLLGLATIDFIILLPLLCASRHFLRPVGRAWPVVGGSSLLFNLLPFGWHG